VITIAEIIMSNYSMRNHLFLSWISGRHIVFYKPKSLRNYCR